MNEPTPILDNYGHFIEVLYTPGKPDYDTIKLWALALTPNEEYVVCVRQDTYQPFLFKKQTLDNWDDVLKQMRK